jgi:hypothetical protein
MLMVSNFVFSAIPCSDAELVRGCTLPASAVTLELSIEFVIQSLSGAARERPVAGPITVSINNKNAERILPLRRITL